MGSASSKPNSDPKVHVWNSDTPVSFSSPLVDSLQNSTETDTTRSQTLELHIQNRVAAELKTLQARAENDFLALQEKISAQPSPPTSTSEQSAGDALRTLGRESVQNEVLELRKKLEERKKLAVEDEGVRRAKEEVVKCLRANDRRPLDCWREVQTFKEEVRRLEGEWVERVVR